MSAEYCILYSLEDQNTLFQLTVDTQLAAMAPNQQQCHPTSSNGTQPAAMSPNQQQWHPTSSNGTQPAAMAPNQQQWHPTSRPSISPIAFTIGDMLSSHPPCFVPIHSWFTSY